MGAYGPIKDGLTHLTKVLLSSNEDADPNQKSTTAEDVSEAVTSEEESELPGTKRPKRRWLVGLWPAHAHSPERPGGGPG